MLPPDIVPLTEPLIASEEVNVFVGAPNGGKDEGKFALHPIDEQAVSDVCIAQVKFPVQELVSAQEGHLSHPAPQPVPVPQVPIHV